MLDDELDKLFKDAIAQWNIAEAELKRPNRFEETRSLIQQFLNFAM
jgi:hypothetical protein